jgi:hypothetical protein
VRGDFFVLPDRPVNLTPGAAIFYYGGISNSGFLFTNNRINNEPMICPQWGMTMWVGNNDNWMYRVYSDQVWTTNGSVNMSDRRLKTNIHLWNESALDKIMRLNIYRYDMDASKYTNVPDYKKEQMIEESKNKIGFMAQELQVEFPEVVEVNSDTEYLGVNYSMMVPVLLEAIKEQQQLILKLQARLEALETK